MHKAQSRLAFSLRDVFLSGVLWSVAFEVVTCLLRFGFSLESTRDTASTIGRLTMGVRVHHSYLGILCIALSMRLEQKFPRTSFHLLTIGIGLFLSDLIHHFVVLWLITGNPQFDLMY